MAISHAGVQSPAALYYLIKHRSFRDTGFHMSLILAERSQENSTLVYIKYRMTGKNTAAFAKAVVEELLRLDSGRLFDLKLWKNADEYVGIGKTEEITEESYALWFSYKSRAIKTTVCIKIFLDTEEIHLVLMDKDHRKFPVGRENWHLLDRYVEQLELAARLQMLKKDFSDNLVSIEKIHLGYAPRDSATKKISGLMKYVKEEKPDLMDAAYPFAWELPDHLKEVNADDIDKALQIIDAGLIKTIRKNKGKNNSLFLQFYYDGGDYCNFKGEFEDFILKSCGGKAQGKTMSFKNIPMDVMFGQCHKLQAKTAENVYHEGCYCETCPKKLAAYITYLKEWGLFDQYMEERKEYVESGHRS